MHKYYLLTTYSGYKRQFIKPIHQNMASWNCS